MIKKYIKKPVEVEAIQLTKENIIEVIKFLGVSRYYCPWHEDEEKAIKMVLENGYVFFETYDKYGETTEEVYFEKYVVKDEYSEYRVFDEDEFKELYEEVR